MTAKGLAVYSQRRNAITSARAWAFESTEFIGRNAAADIKPGPVINKVTYLGLLRGVILRISLPVGCPCNGIVRHINVRILETLYGSVEEHVSRARVEWFASSDDV